MGAIVLVPFYNDRRCPSLVATTGKMCYGEKVRKNWEFGGKKSKVEI